MIYSGEQLIMIAAIMTFGSVVQGAVGFASGLIGVPLLVLAGFSIPEAATINLCSTSVQNASGAWQLRSHLVVSDYAVPVLFRWLAIPCGTYAAFLANQHLAPAQSKQLVGMFLLAVVLLLLLFRIQPRERISLAWQALAFSTSGFLMGFASLGGAPMVVYVNSLKWSASKSRSFLFICSALALPIAFAAFWWKYGQNMVAPMLSTFLVMPAILAGLTVGLFVGRRLSKPLFRRITFGLIIVIALTSILAPLFSGQSGG